MLSRLARVLMVLTSLAPMLLVYGVTLLPSARAWPYMGAALLTAAACFGLLRYVEASGERELLQIDRTEMQDKEVLAFIVSYLLPLIRPSSVNLAGFAVFGALVIIVLYQSEVLNVNPLLGLMGYQFHKAISRSGASYLIISPRRVSTLKGDLVAIRITDHVWLKVDGA